MAHRTPEQLARRRRVERLIALAAPVLDVVLFAGDKLSRVAGRNEVGPEPPRRLGDGPRSRIGGPPAER